MPISLRNLKIREQILLLTLPPIFVLVAGMGLSFAAFLQARRMERAVRQSQEAADLSESLLRHLMEAYTGVRGYVLTEQPNLLVPYEAASRAVDQDLASMQQIEAAEPAQLAEVEAIRAAVTRWQTQWAEPIIKRPKEGAVSAIEGERSIDPLRAQILKLHEEDRAESSERARAAEDLMRRTLLLGLGLGVLVAGVLLFLARVVTRLIAQPVKQLIAAAEQVSRGEFDPSLPPPAENELGDLSLSFSRMTLALQHEREEIAALNKFSEAVTQCTAEPEVYEHVLHSLKERFQPEQAIIFILKSSENFLEAVASLNPLPESLRAWPMIEEPHNCKAVRLGRRFRVNDVAAEPLCPARFASPTQGSYYCGPLIAGGVIIGAVRLEGPKDCWLPERESLVESYLSGAATALANLRHLQKMKRQANVDELTGLYNRRFLEDYARKLIAIASRKETPLGVIMLDLDHFKDLNDRYGHEAGDRVLRQFSKTVTQAMRQTNLAVRYGGEEFLVLLPDTDSQACFRVAERIREAVAGMAIPSGGDKALPPMTVSLGIAVYPEHGKDLEELLKASDKALYESKRGGRNRTTIYIEQVESAS